MEEVIVKWHRPSELYFTKENIKAYFDSGATLHAEIERIKKLSGWWIFNKRDPALELYMPLEVGKCRGDKRLFCNNNRKLYLFRVLQKQGCIETVKVRESAKKTKYFVAAIDLDLLLFRFRFLKSYPSFLSSGPLKSIWRTKVQSRARLIK